MRKGSTQLPRWLIIRGMFPQRIAVTLTGDLKAKYRTLWEGVVMHPFIVEMGDGTLPESSFRRYFVQDYAVVGDIVAIVAQGMAKAPDFEAAAVLNRFMTGILNPENEIFLEAFRGFQATPEELAAKFPITEAFGDFLGRTGLEGSFADIATVLYVTEGTYLDWAVRLMKAKKRPKNKAYQAWIDIHGPDVLGEVVGYLGSYLDVKLANEHRANVDRLFRKSLRYEYRFFEAAYAGEQWHDE
ncbi:MAG: hypothetical protein FJ317_06975 [SAR202 cluster bacterium]|nr:hypothetical protein [SAR202 cluster bacterium]